MELWNFNNIPFVILFTIIVASLFLIVFVSVLYLLSSIRENDFFTQLSYERNTTIIYIIDVKKNKMQISARYSGSLTDKLANENCFFFIPNSIKQFSCKIHFFMIQYTL